MSGLRLQKFLLLTSPPGGVDGARRVGDGQVADLHLAGVQELGPGSQLDYLAVHHIERRQDDKG